MIKEDVTRNTPKAAIKWLQEKLNKVLPGPTYIPLKTDGIFSPKVRIAVLVHWES